MIINLIAKLLETASNVAEVLFWLGVVIILLVVVGMLVVMTGLILFIAAT